MMIGDYKEEIKCCANCGRKTEDGDEIRCIPRGITVKPTGGCDDLFMSVLQMEQEENARIEKEITEAVKSVSGINASMTMNRVGEMMTFLELLKIVRLMFDRWREEKGDVIESNKSSIDDQDQNADGAGWDYDEIPTRLPLYDVEGEFSVKEVGNILWVKSSPIRKMVDSGEITFSDNSDDQDIRNRKVDMGVILSIIEKKRRIRRTVESMENAMELYNAAVVYLLENPFASWENVFSALRDHERNVFNTPSAMWVALRLFEKLGGNANVILMKERSKRKVKEYAEGVQEGEATDSEIG